MVLTVIQSNKRVLELKIEMERVDKKYYIKEEMTKEKFDKMMLKLINDEKRIYKNLAGCEISISNLQNKIIEAGELCSKLPLLWKSSNLTKKETLQKLVYPEGLGYDKKKQAFRTIKINDPIFQIARLSGDFAIIKKGLSSLFEPKSLFAEKEGFEPPVPRSTTVFKTAAFDHSATSPVF